MSKFYTFFKNNKAFLLSILLFSFGIVIIMLFLPKERKFEYEYHQNKIWFHDDLFAPFSFSIDKTDRELRRERDSLLKEFAPFYDFDTLVYKTVSDSLHIKIAKLFPFETEFEKVLRSSLLQVYSIGIVNTQKPYKNVIVHKKPERLRVSLESLYTISEAHDKVITSLLTRSDSSYHKQIKEIVFATLVPNLIYNDSVSNERKVILLSKISEKYGYISEGTRIISKGSIVTDVDVKVLDSLRREYESSQISVKNMIAIFSGQLILILISFFVLILLIMYSQPEVLRNYKYALFIVTIVVLFVALASISLKFNHVSIYLIPYVAMPIVIKNFLNVRIALFVHIVTMLIIGFIAPNSFDFVFLQIAVGVIALFSIGNHYQRSFLFVCAIISFVSYSVVYIGISLIKEGSFGDIQWMQLLWFGASCILLLTTYLLIFIFERIYRLPSDLTLFELSDTNRGVLRELSEHAPGTFQHSLQVANLTEAALRKINGNVLLGRVAGLYHDIGKLKNPAFFIENQSFMGNPHDDLSPLESAEIIINHVTYGKELAKKHKLPDELASMIYGHHGNSKTMFFLDKQRKLFPEQELNELIFQYPAPKIVEKELAVLMIADTVEAASRSIQIHSKEQIFELVQKIIDNLIQEKHFEQVNITLHEIYQVKEVIQQKLVNMYHARIPYPEKQTV